ncbi:MAG: YjfB family protein [Lachnospiraceae bacterium]|nr:YjfB family protein [Lachnospiraceae bacterium]
MDIAQLSTAMSASQVQTAFGAAMLSKTLDTASVTGAQITDMIDASAMERSVNPAVGANFDMYI